MTRHLSEEELIGYQLGESADSASVAGHLEQCGACATAAESIAETLRIFSGEAVPEAEVDRAWQRLRGSLPLLAASSERHARKGWLTGWRTSLAWMSGAALVAVVLGFVLHRVPQGGRIGLLPGSKSGAGTQPGPLTTRPQDQEMATHLEDAERLLTEMDHSGGSLDEATRERAAQMLLTNAVYVQRAQQAGQTAQASVLEELGRTLTAVEHEPARPARSWDVRMEMNTGGLLLDIRILQQNDSEPTRKGSQ